MKIVFASFQGINKKNVPEGMTRLILPILEYFDDSSKYYVSYVAKDMKNIRSLGSIHVIFTKLIAKISNILNINIGLNRFLRELIYDMFLFLKMKEPVILISTAYIPRTAKRNQKMGGINIFLAGSPYDRCINDILQKEKLLFNLQFTDPYTYKRRLNFIDDFLSLQDHIVAQTQITYDSFLDWENVSLSEVDIVPSKALFENSNVLKNKEFTFVYIAHTVWLKGLIYLIQAWNSLDSVCTLKLLVGGSIHPVVKSEIEKYTNKNIEFIGPVHGEGLNQLFRKSHVCIVSSLIDDHPATVAEALYCGLPVIATEGCGSKILIKNSKNGFIVPVADASKIAEKIQWFVDNQDKFEDMSTNAIESINTLENSDQNELLANHFLKVIDKLKIEKSIF